MFTLDQIAHFDRCVFPENFRDDLVKEDISIEDANVVFRYIVSERRKGNNVGIIDIYQEFISWTEIKEAIENMLRKFVLKHHQSS